jgi:hypothetical protein
MPSALQSVLSDEKQAELREFLREHTLEQGREWLKTNAGLTRAKSSLSEWVGWYDMIQDCKAFSSDLDGVVEELKAAKIDADTAAKVGHAVFLSRAAKSGDAKTYATVASVVLRAAELEAAKIANAEKNAIAKAGIDLRKNSLAIAERKIAALEKKAAQLEEKNRLAIEAAKQAKNKLKTQMTDEERAALVALMDEQILGKKRAS